jgi:catechol 2,3-dioxygenase-like lactoylglutathione lyase family enzyme
MTTSMHEVASDLGARPAAPDVEGLLRVRLRATRPTAWAELAPRLDGRGQPSGGDLVIIAFAGGKTLQVEQGSGGELASMDWYARDGAALESVTARAAALAGELGTPSARPHVDGVFPSIALADPDGVRVELSTQTPHPSDGEQAELGHVVMGVTALDRSLRFYTEVLGLQVSDRVTIPLPNGGSTVGVFLRAGDARHHSLALIDTVPGVRHVMIEMRDVDTVGRAYDSFVADAAVTRTLGRHTNDGMFSFYAAGPDRVEVEIGCGGRLVDDRSWSVVTHDRPSVWGHHFVRGRGEGRA